MVNQLKTKFGNKCSGIKINADIDFFVNNPVKKLTFCEALNYSFDVPLMLHKDNICGIGTIRTFGFIENDKNVAKEIARNKNFPVSAVKNILSQIPHLNIPVENVVMGITEELEEVVDPDLYVISTYDEDLFKYIHLRLDYNPYKSDHFSILPVCCAFSKCYINNIIAVSECNGPVRSHMSTENSHIIALPAFKASYLE